MKHLIRPCPSCGNELTRVKRTGTDRVLNAITFSKFYNKRYYCYCCLKPVIFNSNQLIFDTDKSTPKRKQSFKLELPRVFISAFLLSLVVLLAIAGNYFLTKNSMGSDISSVQTESTEK
jgi:hypothetical protein